MGGYKRMHSKRPIKSKKYGVVSNKGKKLPKDFLKKVRDNLNSFCEFIKEDK